MYTFMYVCMYVCLFSMYYECMFVYILYIKAFDIDIILYSYIHTDGTYIHTYI